MSEPLVVTGALTIPASDLTVSQVRSSGPGGQNVNKVATKIELRFDLAGTAALGREVKVRLRALAGGRLDARGALVVTSQRTRSQKDNLEDARQKLRTLVLRALVPPKARRPTRPTLGSKRRRLGEKRQRGQTKRARGKSDWDES